MASSAPGILNWSAASSLLQLNPASEVLPTRAECPQCRKPGLLVYCTTVRETWHCCSECNFSGNLLDLCATAWKLTKPETLQKLTSDGFTKTSEENRLLGNWDRYAKRRAWYSKLWQMAAHNEILTRRYLKSYCNVTATVTSPLWAETLGRICGVVRGYTFYHSKTRKLKGTQRPVASLVLPFSTRPQQLCGLLAFHDRTSSVDPIYSATGGDPISFRSIYRSSGFMALDAVLQSRSQKIVVLTDPVRALGLHVRHSAVSKIPLPVTAVYWDEKQRVRSQERDWHALADRDVYHVCFEFSSRTLAMASWSGGKILHLHIEAPKDRRDWYVRPKPTDLAEFIFENAEPWPAVFAKVAAKLDDTELLKIWQEAIIHGMARDSLRSLPPKLAQRISRLLDGTDGNRSYMVSRTCYIFKRNSQFYSRVITRKMEDEYLILDADIRVRTLEQNKGDDFICRGELIHRQGKPVEFTARLKEWETDFAKWLRAFTVKHRLGYIYYTPSWNDRIIRVIMAFHPPYQATRRAAKQEAAEPESSSCGVASGPISPFCEDQDVGAVASPPESLPEVLVEVSHIQATPE